MISLYISNRTWLHRIPAGTKLAMLAASSMLVLPLHHWALLLLGCTVAVLGYASIGLAGLARLRNLRGLLPLVLGLGLFQGVVASWDTALVSVFKILLMVMLADLVTATTPMQDMMRAIQPLLLPLRMLGLRPARLSLAVALVIRFIPVLLAQWQSQREAWLARSTRRPGIKLLVPFMLCALRRTDQIAESISSRSRS